MMRSREEVLAEYGISPFSDVGVHSDVHRMADRIRELESPPRPEPVAWGWVEWFVHDVHKTGRAMERDFGDAKYNTIADYLDDIEASEAHFVARLRGSLEVASHPSAAAGAVTEDEIDDMVDAAVESLALAAGKAFRAGHSFMASPRDVRQAMASALVAIASRTTPAPVVPVVTSEIIDAGARALCDAFRVTHRDGDDYAPFDQCQEEGKNVWRGLANTTIRAAMKHAASEVRG